MIRLTAVLLLVCSSCASVVTGTEDTVFLTTTPYGASFQTNTGHQGKTPATITIPDKVDLVVDFSLDGYQDARAELPRCGSAWMLGNVLIGGVVGFVIDISTGNYWTHPSKLEVTLVPVEDAATP